MKKVLVATVKPFAKAAIEGIGEILDNTGYELVLLEKYADQQELINAVDGMDALIVRSDIVDKDVIAAGKDLKIIVRAGAGYDNIDLDAATAKDIVVMNTPGQNSNAVAELALGMMVYQARNQFNGKPGTELLEKKIGIHAFGNVGRHVARIARGFGMNVAAFDPFIPDDVIEKEGVEVMKSVEDLYSTCQYISLHIPSNEKTRKSINNDLLKLMPKGATLVNTARKEVIDEDSLMKTFTEREDFSYVSDIAPDNAEELKEKFGERCFFTPKKMGAQTAEANINAGLAAANQIIDFIEKGDTTFKVN